MSGDETLAVSLNSGGGSNFRVSSSSTSMSVIGAELVTSRNWRERRKDIAFCASLARVASSRRMLSTVSSAGPPIVEVTELTRTFGPRRAVAGVTFSLAPGECLALFGPNGAGKTTLLRMLAGLLRPTSGSARVSGIGLPGGALARAGIGLISDRTMLYGALTPRENVTLAPPL